MRLIFAATIVTGLSGLAMTSIADTKPVTKTSTESKVEVIASYMVKPDSTKQMDKIAENFEVKHRHGEEFEIYVLAEEQAKFLKLAPQARLLDADINDELRAMVAQNAEAVAGYRSITEVYAYMHDLAEANPEIVSIEEYGRTEQNRPLYALKISDNVTTDEDEPELLITSATHGDELITVEVNLRLIDELVAGYGNDERLTAMIDSKELYFIPVVNADGFASRSRYANGVDPNREYPWPERPSRDPVACIKAEMEWFAGREFLGAMDFHASGEMVMHPWGYTYSAPRDDTVMGEFSRHLAEENRYRAGQISKVIYVAKGSSADFWYWEHKTMALGIELARSKVPSTSQIPGVVDDAREMTWRFIEYF